MEVLRRRIPFQLEEDESTFLDEEQQNALIDKFRSQNSSTNAFYSKVLYCFLGIFLILFSLSFFNETASNIPYPTLFIFLGLFVNLNLYLLVSPPLARRLLGSNHSIPLPLSYCTSYMLAIVAPTLCFFVSHGVPWHTFGWWCLPVLIVFITHTIADEIESGNRSISELEASRYRAPGA